MERPTRPAVIEVATAQYILELLSFEMAKYDPRSREAAALFQARSAINQALDGNDENDRT